MSSTSKTLELSDRQQLISQTAIKAMAAQHDSLRNALQYAKQKAFDTQFLMPVVEQISNKIAAGAKKPIEYIQFSFLLSNCLCSERKLKIDFYDRNHFADVEEIEAYFEYEWVFPDIEANWQLVVQRLSSEVPRMTESELLEVRFAYFTMLFQALQQHLTYWVQTDEFKRVIQPVCGSKVHVLYGALLDQYERIATLAFSK